LVQAEQQTPGPYGLAERALNGLSLRVERGEPVTVTVRRAARWRLTATIV